MPTVMNNKKRIIQLEAKLADLVARENVLFATYSRHAKNTQEKIRHLSEYLSNLQAQLNVQQQLSAAEEENLNQFLTDGLL